MGLQLCDMTNGRLEPDKADRLQTEQLFELVMQFDSFYAFRRVLTGFKACQLFHFSAEFTCTTVQSEVNVARWDVRKAVEHLEELAAKHKITIRWSDKPEWANSHRRFVQVHYPRNAYEYLGALHEFGHIISPRAQRHEKRWAQARTSRPMEFDDCLLMESAAWAWAIRHCHKDLYHDIPPTTWKHIGTCLASYLPEIHTQKVGQPEVRVAKRKNKR